MASAGLTVIQQEGLLPEVILRRVEALPKDARSVAVGKLSRLPAFAGLSTAITAGIRARLETMLSDNGIGMERILSVKRDAVFVTGPSPSRLVLGDGTRFRLKATYTAFLKLPGIEMYAVPKRGIADIKGIPPERRHLHERFTTRMVLDVLAFLERDAVVDAAATLQRFRREYVARQLPRGFYREFNSASDYALRSGRSVYRIGGEDVPVGDLEIAYNVRNVVIPMMASFA